MVSASLHKIEYTRFVSVYCKHCKRPLRATSMCKGWIVEKAGEVSQACLRASASAGCTIVILPFQDSATESNTRTGGDFANNLLKTRPEEINLRSLARGANSQKNQSNERGASRVWLSPLGRFVQGFWVTQPANNRNTKWNEDPARMQFYAGFWIARSEFYKPWAIKPTKHTMWRKLKKIRNSYAIWSFVFVRRRDVRGITCEKNCYLDIALHQ